jgi:mRNA interferase MazF
VADAGGRDLILCQITSRFRVDSRAVELLSGDFEKGKLTLDSIIRPNRLFTVEKSVILYVAGRVRSQKLDEVAKLREIFA